MTLYALVIPPAAWKEEKKGASLLLFIQYHKPSAVHCLVIMIKRCTAQWKLESLRFVFVQSASYSILHKLQLTIYEHKHVITFQK